MNDASSITMQMLSNHNMTAKDLEALYGRSLTAKELAKFLGLDTRTVKKYAYRWGGVEVSPGNWRFFENRIKEVLNAEFDNGSRKKKIPWYRNGEGSPERPTVSERQQGFDESGGGMGKKAKTRAKRANGNSHGINFN